jgi:hypothetical protein
MATCHQCHFGLHHPVRHGKAFVVITVELTMVSTIKVVIPEDQWISMALVQFMILRDDRGMFGCGEDRVPNDRCFAAVLASGGGNTGRLRSWWCFWALSPDFRGKTLGLTLTGCTWQ